MWHLVFNVSTVGRSKVTKTVPEKQLVRTTHATRECNSTRELPPPLLTHILVSTLSVRYKQADFFFLKNSLTPRLHLTNTSQHLTLLSVSSVSGTLSDTCMCVYKQKTKQFLMKIGYIYLILNAKSVVVVINNNNKGFFVVILHSLSST